MKSNWKHISDLIFGHEGKLSLDPEDRGNWTSGKPGVGQLKGTKYGISAMSYPKEDIAALTRARALELYKRDYWDKVQGDSLPSGLDYTVMDYAVNSGVGQAAKDLQRSLGNVSVDGIIGSATLAALGKASISALINDINDRRLSLMMKNSKWSRYKNGWTMRVAQVRSGSLAMVQGMGAEVLSTPAQSPARVLVEDTRAMASAENKALAGGGAAASGASAIEGLKQASEHIDAVKSTIEPLAYYMAWAQYVFVALLIASLGIGIVIAIRKKKEV